MVVPDLKGFRDKMVRDSRTNHVRFAEIAGREEMISRSGEEKMTSRNEMPGRVVSVPGRSDNFRENPGNVLKHSPTELNASPKHKAPLAKIRQKWFKPNRKLMMVAIAILVVVGAVGSFLLVREIMTSTKITLAETQLSLSSRTTDAPVQSEFKVKDPIMLHLKFSGAKTGEAINFKVVNKDNKVIRSGSTTILRESAKDPDSGQRYISIVNTASTQLAKGEYRVMLSIGGRVIETVKFTVK